MTDLKNRLRKEMTGTNVALLTTSDIFTTTEPDPQRYLRLRDGVNTPDENYGLKAEASPDRRFWTRGVLEMALAMGFTVWVVSTRQALGPTDSWWTKLIPGQYTILRGHDLAKRWKDRVLKHFKERLDEDSLEEFAKRLSHSVRDQGHTLITLPYIVWCLIAELEWPVGFDGSPAHWTSGLAQLEDEGYIVRSTFFTDQMEATNDEIIAECKKVIRARKPPPLMTTDSDMFSLDEEIRAEAEKTEAAVIRALSGHVVDGPNIRNGTCIDCGCASGECEC